VEYELKKEAEAAIAGMDGKDILGETVCVDWAFVQPKGRGGALVWVLARVNQRVAHLTLVVLLLLVQAAVVVVVDESHKRNITTTNHMHDVVSQIQSTHDINGAILCALGRRSRKRGTKHGLRLHIPSTHEAQVTNAPEALRLIQ